MIRIVRCVRRSRERCLLTSSYLSFRLSVSPSVSLRLPLDGISWNLILGTSTKICWKIPDLVKIGQKILGTLYEDICVSYCWQRHRPLERKNTQNTFLFFPGKTFSIFCIGYSDICTSKIKRERIFAFPWQQLLRERATMLRYTISFSYFLYLL